MKPSIKISKENEGRPVTLRGREEVIAKVLNDKKKFRIAQGEGGVVLDFSIDDIEKAEGLIVDIG